jgi:branched-chain amino acid transport system substrate-binding protein
MNMKFIHRLLSTVLVLLSTAATAQEATSRQTQPIWLGQLASTTNPLVAENAKEYIAGIELALQRINVAGGVKGRIVKLATRDDNFDAARAAILTDELVEEKNIVALLGNYGTQSTLRLGADGVLQKHRLASIGPMTGLQNALNQPNVFAVRASYEDEVLAMMQHSVRLGRKNIAYLYWQAGAGPQLAKLAQSMASESGADLVGVSGFAVTKDIAEQKALVLQAIDTWSGKKPDAVVLIAVAGVHSEAMKALRQKFDASLPVYSLGLTTPDFLIRDIGPVAAAGVMLTQVMPHPDSQSLTLLRNYHADIKRFRSNQQTGYMHLEGYVAGRVAGELLRRAKSLTSQAVLDAALNAGEINVGDFRVTYNPTQRKSLQRVELTMVTRTGKLIR